MAASPPGHGGEGTGPRAVTRRTVLRHSARADLVEQAEWLRERDAPAAARFRDAALATLDRLARYPLIGRRCESAPSSLAGLRSWPVRGFESILVFYRPVGGGIDVVRVLHRARDLPGEFDAEAEGGGGAEEDA